MFSGFEGILTTVKEKVTFTEMTKLCIMLINAFLLMFHLKK